MTESAPELPAAIARRRTFAIIAHPDAGKTTLTEKLLLFGGAIQLAGAVKARGDRRRARSDWMKVERERGISVTTSVMTFDYANCTFNLLDTPGHEDFSEDTYRTLTAVDSAVMVIDAAKGIEAQTRKLFEVCRLRNVPIVTFINKMDREGRIRSSCSTRSRRSSSSISRRPAGRSARAASSAAATTCSRSADADGAHAQAITCRRAFAAKASPIRSSTSCCRNRRSRSCARTSRWSAGCVRRSISRCIARAT